MHVDNVCWCMLAHSRHACTGEWVGGWVLYALLMLNTCSGKGGRGVYGQSISPNSKCMWILCVLVCSPIRGMHARASVHGCCMFSQLLQTCRGSMCMNCMFSTEA